MDNKEYAEFLLEQIKLLSALESWAFSSKTPMPDYLFEKIDRQVAVIEKELLK